MNSKTTSPVFGLILTAALAACGGGSTSTTAGDSGSNNGSVANPAALPASDGSTNSGTTNTPSSSTGSSSPASAVAAAYAAVTATPSYTLTSSISAGSGSITSSANAGNSCSSATPCTYTVPAGTVVTMSQQAVKDFVFNGWSGACSGTGTCSFTMDGDKTISANFWPVVWLTPTITGSGNLHALGVINCTETTCTKTPAKANIAIALTATPATGFKFVSWGGDCAGTTGTTCNLPMDKSESVSVTFASTSTTTTTSSSSATTTTTSSAGACQIPRGTNTSPVFASGHPRILVNQSATLSCLQQQLSSKIASATRFKSYVDSEIASPGSNWGFRYWFPALMYQITGSTSYADFAISKVDAFVASEEAKIAAGNAPTVAGDSYLEIGDYVSDVALTYDWCYSRLTADQRTRWTNYMNQAVWNVWNFGSAKWGGKSFPWSGWSVDNPSNNYYYSFMRATMLAGLATRGENAQAQAWIDQFRTTKIANQLVPTFNRDLTGGGSREGTGYGTAMRGLFEMYDWWERSTGERLATLTPHTLQSMAWLAHTIVPTLDYMASIGDQARDSTVALFDYHREYMLSLISLFPQERMSAVGKVLFDNSSVPKMSNGFEVVDDYLYQPPALPAASVTDLSTTYYGSGTGQVFMRSAWGDKTAAFSSFSCGPYTESHAHRDQGAFQLYRGEWLAPTGGIYTASGIEQQEELNNLVRVQVNGSTVRQQYNTSCSLLALADNSLFTYAVADATNSYNNPAFVSKSQREYLFIKPSTFIVFDRVASPAGSKRIWTLNLPGAPTVSGDHLSYTGAKGNALDVFRVAPTGLSYSVNTSVMVESGDRLTNANAKRIDVVDTAGTQSNFLHIMDTNGAVSAATRSDATNQTGASVTLADGRTVTVRFGNTTSGGTLEIKSATGTTQFSGALPTTVVAPPLYRN